MSANTEAFTKILLLLEEPLDAGLDIELGLVGGVPSVDLNTKGKSHCYLRYVDGKIISYRRYDREQEVESYEELIEIVYDCVHGRNFFNGVWLKIFEKHGYDNPLGEL